MKTKTKKKLPKKLSGVAEVALHDFDVIRKDKHYHIDMSLWHEPNSRCSVCMAGAVMAVSLEAARDAALFPSDFDEKTESRLIAINAIRQGDFIEAAGVMGIEPDFDQEDALEKVQENWRLDSDVAETDWPKFKKHMMAAIETLKEAGL